MITDVRNSVNDW